MLPNKTSMRLLVVALLATSLSGCLLTKLVTMPMRVAGSALSVVGAVVSVVPVVGDSVDEALEAADEGIDKAADAVDKVPI
ncbi:hypothetical protein DFR26_1739 [Paraperlucidibaca baekdonensis]|uniref:Lipoprotein n=1 Tax=Paraperlucidibaca baekdonensis TaxID=748120 RepID=A0A3E0H537_9GAMM|nr:DUF6726 family protein [Paraperlucidibaca baekdonensis]REH37954.1 hypothetical protein DFR26_1739 [Paraperlucidibaca baekdonensis]